MDLSPWSSIRLITCCLYRGCGIEVEVEGPSNLPTTVRLSAVDSVCRLVSPPGRFVNPDDLVQVHNPSGGEAIRTRADQRNSMPPNSPELPVVSRCLPHVY